MKTVQGTRWDRFFRLISTSKKGGMEMNGQNRAVSPIRLCGTDFLRFDAGEVARDQSSGRDRTQRKHR